MVKFGDVVKNAAEVERDPLGAGLERLIGLDDIEPGNLHIKTWGLVADGTSFSRRFRKGQVLFAKRRAYQRKVAVAEFDGICSSDILTFEPRGDDLIPELLPFIVQSDGFFDHALGTSAGSLSPRTRWSQLRTYEFALPPKDKQHRIAELLSCATACIDEADDCARQASLAGRVLTTRLLTRGSGGDQGVNATKLGQLPETWRVARLGDLADVMYGITLNAERRTLKLQMPYLRVANVFRGHFELGDVKDVGCTTDEIETYRLRKGDVLVVEGHADVQEIGRAATWLGAVEDCLHQNHLLRVRCGSDLLPMFLTMFLNSPKGRRHFRRVAKSTSGLFSINSRVLKGMLVPVPPRDEQEKIAGILGAFRSQEEALSRHAQVLREMTRCLREHLLRG